MKKSKTTLVKHVLFEMRMSKTLSEITLLTDKLSKTRRKMTPWADQVSTTRRKITPLADKPSRTRRKMTPPADQVSKTHRKITLLADKLLKTCGKIDIPALPSGPGQCLDFPQKFRCPSLHFFKGEYGCKMAFRGWPAPWGVSWASLGLSRGIPWTLSSSRFGVRPVAPCVKSIAFLRAPYGVMCEKHCVFGCVLSRHV